MLNALMILALVGLPMMFVPFLSDSAGEDEGESGGGDDNSGAGGPDDGGMDMSGGHARAGAESIDILDWMSDTEDPDAPEGDEMAGADTEDDALQNALVSEGPGAGDDAGTLDDNTLILGAADMVADGSEADGPDTPPQEAGPTQVKDFDVAEDVLVVLQEPGEDLSVTEQRIENDQVVVVLSNGAEVVLSGLKEALPETQISFMARGAG